MNSISNPLLHKFFLELSAKDILSVQPISAPAGLVFYMDFEYPNKSDVRYYITKGTKVYKPYREGSGMDGAHLTVSDKSVVYTKKDLIIGPIYFNEKFGYYKFKVPDKRYPYVIIHEDNMSITYDSSKTRILRR